MLKKKKNEFEEELDNGLDQNSYDDEYYKLAKEQNFDQLLNKEIQLENAKNNAYKYTQTQMAQNGLDNTGYGSSQQAGIFNNFLNSLVGAQNQTEANNNQLDLEHIKAQEQKDDNRFMNFTALMGNTGSQEELDELFKDYGFDLNTKPDSFSDDDWLQIKAIYRNKQNQFDNNYEFPASYSRGELKTQNYVKNDGSVGAVKEDFVEETDKLFENAENGYYSKGDVIKVTNWENETIYLKYVDGGFQTVSAREYNKAKVKHSLKGFGEKKFEEN